MLIAPFGIHRHTGYVSLLGQPLGLEAQEKLADAPPKNVGQEI